MDTFILSADIILPVSSEPLFKSSILISDGVIKDIGTRAELKLKYPSLNNIIRKNSIILPGFINAHIHLELGWIKNKLGRYNNFIDWLRQLIEAKKVDPEESVIKESVELGITDQINSGVTTVGEISSYNGLDIPILKKSGLRTVLFKEILDRNINSLNIENLEKDELYEERLFPHAPYSCSPQTMDRIFSLKQDIPLGIHLAESVEETKFLKNISNGFDNIIYPLLGKNSFNRVSARSPVKYVSLFNKKARSKITCIHMVNIDDNDLEYIENHNAGIVLCPRSNLLLNVGKPDLDLLKNFDKVGLGTDGLSSNYNLNFIEEIRSLNNLLIETEIENKSFLSVYFATLGGARSLFIDNKTGSIEIDKDADLLCINFGNYPPVDPYHAVISSENKDIEYTMVKGSYLYNRNEH